MRTFQATVKLEELCQLQFTIFVQIDLVEKIMQESLIDFVPMLLQMFIT